MDRNGMAGALATTGVPGPIRDVDVMERAPGVIMDMASPVVRAMMAEDMDVDRMTTIGVANGTENTLRRAQTRRRANRKSRSRTAIRTTMARMTRA